MLEALSRAFFLTFANSQPLKKAISKYGMRGPHSFARRFIGGETVEEVLVAVRELDRHGFAHTLNHLGEHVDTVDGARAATRDYLAAIERVGLGGLPCKVSVKLSQLGLEIGRELCHENLRSIARVAGSHDGFVRIDMEGSLLVDATLDVFETLWTDGQHNLGIVLQSYLRRTTADLERIMALGASVRLCKGAYREPADVAYPDKADVNRAFIEFAKTLLTTGSSPAFATHDPRMITTICELARDRGIQNDGFEFQMLYGVRRDIQASLRDRGYRVRIYVPFGREWFAYFMRRLAERPANVGFVIRSLLYEQRGG